MGLIKYVEPHDVWEFFLSNEERLSNELVVIAEDESRDIEVCMTEDGSFPMFIVLDGSEVQDKCWGLNKESTENALKEIYDKISTDEDVSNEYVEPNDEVEIFRGDYEDKIYEREDELYLAAADFLSVVLCSEDFYCKSAHNHLDDDGLKNEEFINEFVDYVCEYLRKDHGISVYRPTIIEFDGSEVVSFEDYPYD